MAAAGAEGKSARRPWTAVTCERG